MTAITPERIAEIKARTEKATPGPWHVSKIRESVWVVYDIETGIDKHFHQGWEPFCPSDPKATDDANFIYQSRADIPALVAEVERLIGVLRTISTYSTYDAQDLRDIAHNAIQDIQND